MAAEMLAQRCLCESITNKLTDDDLFNAETYTPWKHGTKLMDFVQGEFQQEFVPIKHEWRDSIEPEREWHSASSESSSSTCGPSSARSTTSETMQHEDDSEPEVFWNNLDFYDDWDDEPTLQVKTTIMQQEITPSLVPSTPSPRFVPVTPPLPPPPFLPPIDLEDI